MWKRLHTGLSTKNMQSMGHIMLQWPTVQHGHPNAPCCHLPRWCCTPQLTAARMTTTRDMASVRAGFRVWPHLPLLRDDRRSCCCVDSKVDDRLVLILHLHEHGQELR